MLRFCVAVLALAGACTHDYAKLRGNVDAPAGDALDGGDGGGTDAPGDATALVDSEPDGTGADASVPCEQSETRCKPGSTNTIQLCGAQGAWTDLVTCNGGDACLDGACVACSPDAQQCVGGKLQTCDETGAWGSGVDCPSATPFCSPTSRSCVECKVGTWNCSGTTLQSCDASTEKWKDDKVCSSSTATPVCSVAATGCVACTPDDTRCGANNILERCSANYSWQDDQMCPAATPYCIPGAKSCSSTMWLNGYGVSGSWHGYAFTDIQGTGTISPLCDDAGSLPCYKTAGNKVCASGSIGPDTTYNSVAVVGWYVAQAAVPPNPAGLIATTGTGLTVDLTVTTGTGLRIQVQSNNSTTFWCAPIPTGGKGQIPWNKFNSRCWDGSGTTYTVGTPIERILVIAPSNNVAPVTFDVCINSFSAY